MALRRPRAILYAALLLVAMCTLSGCVSWRVVDLPRQDLPLRVRLETVSRGRIEMRHPVLQDTVITGVERHGNVPTRVPLSDVVEVRGAYPNPSGTATLLAISGVVLIGWWIVGLIPST